MVKIMEAPIKMDDLGGKNPYFWKHPVREVEKISPWKMSFVVLFLRVAFSTSMLEKEYSTPPKVSRQFAPESHEGWEMP